MSEANTSDTRLPETVKSVVAALDRQDQPEAMRLARVALDKGLVHPVFLNLRAFWYEGRDRLPEALADLQKAHTLFPDDVPILNALGLLLARIERPIEATQAFEKAVALQPDFVPARFNHGWSCEVWGEVDRAKKSYEQALEMSAGEPSAVEPLARLAGLAVRRGDWDEARKYARQALEMSPSHPIALLTQARVEIQAGRFGAAERWLYQILTATTLSRFDRYFAMGALGDLRHAQARYADAFKVYAEGNLAYREAAGGRYKTGETAIDAMRWMREYFEARPSAVAAAQPPVPPSANTRCHVFLVGFIRSGTTLLEQALASHPDVVTMEEKEVFGDSGKFMHNARELDKLRTLSADERAHYAQAYWNRAREQGFEPGGKIFVDKQPFNTLKLPLIAAFFPHAKIIFAVRDPRDVILSCMRRRLTIGALTYQLLTLETAAQFYADYMRLTVQMRRVLPLALHQIRHEDVVDDFAGEVGKVCDFLGIGWTDDMRNFAERRKTRSISSPSAAQIAKGLNREGMGQWRRYQEQMAPALPVLAPWVAHYGYPPD